MKVTTDACIQAAWTPIELHVKRALDIGAGTGLLSLMLAQRSKNLKIDAIEMDSASAKQAKKNVEQSQWSDQIRVVEGDINYFVVADKYDLIVCNPPFFNNSLQSENRPRTMARHTTTLTYTDLITAIELQLKPEAYASILLPSAEFALFSKIAGDLGWNSYSTLEIYHNEASMVNRKVGLFRKNTAIAPKIEALPIYGENGEYGSRFKELLGPFYLNL